MAQLAEPATLVVALQLWAEPPDPRVRVTDLLASGLPKTLRVAERVAEEPLVAVWPRCRRWRSGPGSPTKVLDPLLASRTGDDGGVAREGAGQRVGARASPGVIEQVAVPELLVWRCSSRSR